MSALRRKALALLLSGLALCRMAAALDLTIASPLPGQTVFGAFEIQAAVSPAAALKEVQRIEFYLDGRRVGSASAPPFRIVAEAGQENREHHLEVVAYGASGPLASAELRTPALRVDEQVDVRLQQLFVTVERQGEPVPGLTREDFEVYEDGVRQQVTAFESGEVPFTAVLLLDASTSMQGGRLRTALDGARAFFASMASFDEAKLVLFSDHLLVETPFTSLTPVLTLGLSGVEATGGTALNDALYVALKRLEPRQGRKVVVLLSDGVDVDSVLGMDDVKAALGATPSALLYWLRLRREEEEHLAPEQIRISTAWRDPEGHRHEREQLRKAVLASGGRIATIDRVDQVKGALSGILRELRGQYVLGYYPKGGSGGHAGGAPKIEIRLRPRGLDLRVSRGERGR